jgi:hypothetical protein
MLAPSPAQLVELDDLTRLRLDETPEHGTVADELFEVTVVLAESVAEAVAVLVTDPASTSACVAV